MARARLALLGLLTLGMGCGCGGREASGPDRTRPDAVYAHAMAAANRGDWEALRPLLTDEARNILRTDLQNWQKLLRDPERGAHYQKLATERTARGAEEAFRAARDGTYVEALRFFMLLAPRPDRPPIRQTRIDQGAWEFFYEDDRGVLKMVRLVLNSRDGRWYVSELHL